ncbi:MAG: DUF1015 family protein [Corynebacteriales bacterium]|nr:DUF1015 family protein [Mycobacteriales bacterium]
MQRAPRSTIAHPIAQAWLAKGATGAPNYDEFASDAEVTAAIAANPDSVLAVEMPHRVPDQVGTAFSDALGSALARWRHLQAEKFAAERDVVAPYRITTDDGEFYGVFCLMETAQISSSADEPGGIIRNEDVFINKVRERVALTETLGAALSPVLLLQTQVPQGCDADLRQFLTTLIPMLGAAAHEETDEHGNEHAIWTLGPSPQRDELLLLAGGGELIVADGNHRTLAAQTAGLDKFLAVVTSAESVNIAPYHRLVSELPITVAELLTELKAAGFNIHPETGVVRTGTIELYADGTRYFVELPKATGSVVDTLDHTIVEKLLFNEILDLDAGDKRITYVGGDYPLSWLREQVDKGESAVAIIIAPVRVDDFVAVNLDRLKMPRKSTWFTPKARAGLVCAQVLADDNI